MVLRFNFAMLRSERSKTLALGGRSSIYCRHAWFSVKKPGGGLKWGT